jgi:parallel beta-helix repeat protein
MSLTQLAPPYPIFTDKSGSPLDNGYLYFGTANMNPETNPIQVYYDSAFTQPAAQPLRTSNGYVMRNGSPALIYADSQFSVTVRDKNNALVIYSPVGYGILPGTSATSTDQITYNESSTGAVTRVLTSRLQDYVSVKDFGAVGDGVTDDTAAIQSAINSGAGKILFPKGTFLSGLLTPANNVSLVGFGRGISILKLKSGADTQLVFGTSISAFNISGLEIDGNKSNQSLARNLLQFFSSTNISVVNNHIHDASQDAIYFTGCNDCLIEGNKINDNDRNGVSCGAAVDTSVNMRIMHNDISGHTGANDIGISLEPAAKSLVFGNTLTDNWDGVTLAGDGTETIDCNENTIQGNTITATAASNRAIVVAGVSRVTDNNLILENKISGHYARGIVGLTTVGNTFSGNIIEDLSGTNSLAFEGISIDDSVISNNRIAGSQLHGLLLTSSDGNTIVGNHVFNNSLLAANVRDGIRLDSCSGTTVTGNYSSGTNQQFGIRENTAATANTFSGNYVSGNATGGYYMVANSGSFVDGKLFTSTTAVTITGVTGTDVNLQTTQTPANVHKSYSGLRVLAAGRKTGSAGNKQIKLFFGASSIIVDPAANTTNDWRIEAEVFFVNQTSQKVTITSLDGTSVFQDYGTFSIDTSSATTVKFAGSLGNGADAIIGEVFCVEYIR